MKPQPGLYVILIGLLQVPIYRGGNAELPLILLAGCTAMGLLLASAKQSEHSLATRPYFALCLWLLWLAWIAVLITPLPTDWLHTIAPASAQFHAAISAAGGQAWNCISVTPTQTLNLLKVSATYFLLYLAITATVQQRSDAILVCGLIAVAALLQSIYGALHLLSGLSHPLLEAPGGHQRVATGSFANRNHFTAFLIMGAAACLCLLLGRPQHTVASSWLGRLRNLLQAFDSPVLLLRMMLMGLVIGAILSRSRMGNTALAVGISLFALSWLLTTRQTRSFLSAALLFCSIAILDVLLISQQYGLERVLERIESTDLDQDVRATSNLMSWTLIRQFGWHGSGLGSYRYVQETVRPSELLRLLDHAHNDYLQFWVETGTLGLALMAILVIYHLLRAMTLLRSRRRWRRAFGSAGIMVIGAGMLHATVEFNFQIPGYAAYFVCWLALLASPALARRHGSHKTSASQ